MIAIEQPRKRRSHHKQTAPGGTLTDESIAKFLTGSLSAFGVALTRKPEAALTDGEVELIDPALRSILAKLQAETRQQVETIAAPAVLAVALAFWALRVYQLMPKPEKKAPTRAPVQSPAPSQVVAEAEPTPQGPRVEYFDGHPSDQLLSVLSGGSE